MNYASKQIHSNVKVVHTSTYDTNEPAEITIKFSVRIVIRWCLCNLVMVLLSDNIIWRVYEIQV